MRRATTSGAEAQTGGETGGDLELLTKVIEGTTGYVFAIDRERRIRFASPAALEAMGTAPEEVLGRRYDQLPLPMGTDHERKIDVLFEKGERVEGEATMRSAEGDRYYIYTAVPVRDRDGAVEMVVVTASNVTKQKRAAQLSEGLNRISSAINSTLDIDEIMNRVIAQASDCLRSDATAIALKEGDQWVLRYIRGAIPERVLGAAMSDSQMRACFMGTDECFSGIWDVTKADWVCQDMMKRLGVMSFITIPLKRGDRIHGVLIVANSAPRRFTPEEMDFAMNLSSAISLALDNAELYRSEVEQGFLLKSIIDNVPAVVIKMRGDDLRILWANKASERYRLGKFKDVDTTGRSLQEIIPTAEETGLAQMFRTVAAAGRPFTDQEFALAGLGPDVVYWHGSLIPLKDPSREVPDLLILAVDVTAQVRARKRSEEMTQMASLERDRLQTIIDTLPVGVLIIDRSGRVTEVNGAAERLLGPITPIPREIRDLGRVRAWSSATGQSLKLEDWALVRALFDRARTENELVDVRRYDGRMATFLTSAAPLLGPEEQVVGAVGVVQDITEQVHLEREVVEAKGKAELYVDLLTHDINNLNAAAMGYLQLLDDAALQDRERNWTKRSLDALEESSRLIDAIQSIQQLEAGEATLTTIDLDRMLNDLVKDYSGHPNRNVQIVLSTHGRHCVMATGLVREGFANIIDNAIKHNVGDLRIDIRVGTMYQEGVEYQRVEIEDNGQGIPDEIKTQIFSRSWRGRTKSVGKGLGLFLVKRLVEDVQGRVWVEDRMRGDHRRGAKFVVLLPAAPC